MKFEGDGVAAGGGMIAPETTGDAVFAVMQSLEQSLRNVAKDISESRQFLSTSFGQIAANFAKVHSIAREGEARGAQIQNDTLIALRRIVNGLTVELQFEDSLSQSLGYALRRIDSICVALTQTKAIVAGTRGAHGHDGQGEHALAVLARTLESLRNAERPGGSSMVDGSPGSVDLF